MIKYMSEELPDECTTADCYNYTYINDQGILRIKRNNLIYINYNNTTRFQYNRLVPDYFRKYFPECGFTNYRKALAGTEPISLCLRKQLRFSPINLYSLEEIFIRIVPSINDSLEEIAFKDKIRNEFIAFALNIEKSYLYFNKGRQTCNNNFVPWESVYNLEAVLGQSFDTASVFNYTYGQNIPITQYDQYIIYNLSINYFNNLFSSRNKTQLNYSNLLRLALGLPIVGELTIVNFYNLIYFA